MVARAKRVPASVVVGTLGIPGLRACTARNYRRLESPCLSACLVPLSPEIKSLGNRFDCDHVWLIIFQRFHSIQLLQGEPAPKPSKWLW